MDKETALFLNDLNARFYQTVHESFSETRAGAWPGWERLLGIIEPTPTLSVLDIACGNLRFEKFLLDSFRGKPTFYALDNCLQLVPDDIDVSFREFDVVGALFDGKAEKLDFLAAFNESADSVDLAVSFGFLHHIPGFENRVRFLQSLLSCVRPGGFLAVSLWSFRNSEKLSKKADESTKLAFEHFSKEYGEGFVSGLVHQLDLSDFFLGWQDKRDAFRYCHHFDSEEVIDLVGALSDSAQLVDTYFADGKSGDLNCYLVIKRL